jgi:DNA-binding PadR family transcriptional regulator
MAVKPADFIPLSIPAFQILVALSDQERHGYGIMQDVAARTNGAVKLNAGTLYTTIKRLVDDDLIIEVNAPAGAESSDERRRYYKLTTLGRRVAKTELARLQAIVRRAAATLLSKT